MTITEATKIIKESGNDEEAIRKLRNLPRRQNALPPPEGGIGVRTLSRQYRIPHQTISRWANDGYIPIVRRDRNDVYLDAAKANEVLTKYRNFDGHGRKTIRKVLGL